MEAMAVGVPVIATNIAGTSELIEDGKTGILVRPSDADALAAAMIRLIDDHALRTLISTAARAKIEQEFDIDIEAAKLGEHFRECMNSQHSSTTDLISEAQELGERVQTQSMATEPNGLRQGAHSPALSVIAVSYNTAHLLTRFFAMLQAASRSIDVQLILIENASKDNSLEVMRRLNPAAEIIVNPVNVGFGRANNQAVSLIRGRYVLLLNTDAFVLPETLEKTLSYMEEHPECGVLGVKLTCEDGSLQPSCRFFPTPWNVFLQSTGLKRLFPGSRMVDEPAWDPEAEQECDWVPGCYYLIRRDVVEKVGLFDPRFFLYYEEVDHCRAVKAAGWKVRYYPHTAVVHIGGESAESMGSLMKAGRQISALQIESELLYFRKHYGRAGVLSSVLLTALAESARAARAATVRPDMSKARDSLHHLAVVISTLFRTRLGSKPTR
jgi:GT2 family glycosyltransferase